MNGTLMSIPGQGPEALRATITGVILAGGRATRMGGQDKGLVPLAGKAMVQHVIGALEPQVADIIINANRHPAEYARYGYRVMPDLLEGYCGPLAGIATALRAARTPYIVTTPCDSPFVPADLALRLYRMLSKEAADISIAHDGERLQPVFALIRRSLLDSLLCYLHEGERKVEPWYRQHPHVLCDFSDTPEAFINVNTPADMTVAEDRLRAVATC
ncbi:MAG: molybdenum cofactor guanylyltransferase MobA [Gammaproteobacteria bacterium]